MAEPLFGTPVDGGVVAIREAPKTPLVVRRMDDGVRAHIYVAQPASWHALGKSQRLALETYFQWEDGESHWWRTLRPAVVSLERITPAVWAGHLVEQGVVIHAGDDPAQVPVDENIFRTRRSVPGPTIREPHGPVACPDLTGTSDVFSAAATRIIRATFPAFGSETVWLRLFAPDAERKARLAALDSELDCMRAIAANQPALVPEILHDGRLETLFHTGRYAALRPSMGLTPNQAMTLGGHSGFPPVSQLVRDLALCVARAGAAAHKLSRCLGPLSPELLRVHPITTKHGRRARARVIALPGAGPSEGVVPPSSLELFPEEHSQRLAGQFDRIYRRSPAVDLVGLGLLIEWLVEESAENDPELCGIASQLIDGRIQGAERLVTLLQDLITSNDRR